MTQHANDMRTSPRRAEPEEAAVRPVDSVEPGQLLLSPMQAARRLGIGRSTLYLLLGDGQLESVHIGARRLVPVEGLERFVERLRRGEPVADPPDGTLGRSAAVPRPSRRRPDGPSQPTLPLST